MSPVRPPYETKDTRPGVLLGLIGLLLILLGSVVLVTRLFNHVLYRSVTGRGQPAAMAQLHRLPPEPRLQVNPAEDLVRLRDVENVRLNNYAWVDPSAGKVRIPIERAMEMLAARGSSSEKE